MIRGSSPTVVLQLPFNSNRVTSCYVVFMQKESLYINRTEPVFVKTKEECRLEGDRLLVPLSANDTLLLDDRRPLEVQVECHCGSSKLVSKVISFSVDDFGVSKAVNSSLDGSVKMVNPYMLDFGVIHEVKAEVTSHNELTDRDMDDQHHIKAVTGLPQILNKLIENSPEGTFSDEELQEALGNINEGDITEEELKDMVENPLPEKGNDPTGGLIDRLWQEIIGPLPSENP